MDKQYFYALDGERKGPISFADLRQLATKGELSRQTKVWCRGMKDWQPASSVAELFVGLPPDLEGEPSDLPPPLSWEQRPALTPGATLSTVAPHQIRKSYPATPRPKRENPTSTSSNAVALAINIPWRDPKAWKVIGLLVVIVVSLPFSLPVLLHALPKASQSGNSQQAIAQMRLAEQQVLVDPFGTNSASKQARENVPQNQAARIPTFITNELSNGIFSSLYSRGTDERSAFVRILCGNAGIVAGRSKGMELPEIGEEWSPERIVNLVNQFQKNFTGSNAGLHVLKELNLTDDTGRLSAIRDIDLDKFYGRISSHEQRAFVFRDMQAYRIGDRWSFIPKEDVANMKKYGSLLDVTRALHKIKGDPIAGIDWLTGAAVAVGLAEHPVYQIRDQKPIGDGPLRTATPEEVQRLAALTLERLTELDVLHVFKVEGYAQIAHDHQEIGQKAIDKLVKMEDWAKTTGSDELAFIRQVKSALGAEGFSPKAEPAPAPPPIQNGLANRRPFIIKGFFIGMTRDEVKECLSTQRAKVFEDTPLITKGYVGPGGYVTALFNKKGALIRLDINESATDKLFNVADMQPDAFAQSFIDHYRIPSMQPFSNGRLKGWRYRNEEEGFEIAVYSSLSSLTGNFTRKKICFIRMPKPADRKFDQGSNPDQFAVKGFYVGMSRQSAKAQLAAISVGTNFLMNRDTLQETSVYSTRTANAKILFFYDDKECLKTIEFSEPMINELFNVFDLDAQSFMEKFCDNYGIQMDRLSSGPHRGWNYLNSRDGYEVAIYNGKRVCLRQVPKSAERKFD
jgi:hypothetical protein